MCRYLRRYLFMKNIIFFYNYFIFISHGIEEKQQPPSMMRYAENHPSVTFHLTKEDYKDLWEMVFNNDKSMNHILKEAVGILNKD